MKQKIAFQKFSKKVTNFTKQIPFLFLARNGSNLKFSLVRQVYNWRQCKNCHRGIFQNDFIPTHSVLCTPLFTRQKLARRIKQGTVIGISQPLPKEGAFSALMHCKTNHATSLRDPDFCPRNIKIGPGFQVDNRILFRIERHFSTTDLENVDKII